MFFKKNKNKIEFTITALKDKIKEISGHDFNELIETVGEKGNLDGMLSSCIMDCNARLYFKNQKLADYGFEFDNLSEGEITGLKKDSNAYRAGLRLWQEFVRDETPKEELEKEGARTVTIVVKDHTDSEKKITYTTEEKTVKTPQYKLD